MPEKILVVDDDETVSQYIHVSLENAGYLPYSTSRGKIALNWLKEPEKPSLIILDIGLPDIDGLDICKALKKDPETRKIPILILTVRTENRAKIEAGLAHADLFLNKPVEEKDLLDAVRALLRSPPRQRRGLLYRAGLKVDPDRHTVFFKRNSVDDLSTRLFDLFYLLVEHCPNTLTRRHIISSLKVYDRDREVDVWVSRLRKVLLKEFKVDMIKTIPNEGYCLEVPAQNSPRNN